MHYTILIIYFLLFSFLGWILDSVFSTFDQRRIINSGYFRELPLCPLYGVGGVVLFLFTKWMIPYPWYVTVLTTGVLLSLVEYVGGIFCVTVLKERLWDYSHTKWHLSGHIEVFHSACWIILSGIFYFYLFPKLLVLQETLDAALSLTPASDMLIFITFLVLSAGFTYKRRKTRLGKLKKGKRRH